MNKKPVRTGPRIRITHPANRVMKMDELTGQQLQDAKYVYHCQYCRLKFTHNSHFFLHMSYNHKLQQKQAKFECNDCHIVFAKKSTLDLHCQTHHLLKSKSKCESCGIRFKSRYCLRRHLKLKQAMNENSCLKCQKKFLSKDSLVKHISNKHTFKNLTYECDFCTLKFKAKESLQTHMTRMHKIL